MSGHTSQVEFKRRVKFSAGHRYWRPEWSEAQNRETFGPCSNAYGHGHNYQVWVTVRGAIQPLTGFSVDLPALDRWLHETIFVPLDHHHLNHVIPEFAEGKLIPSCENLAVWLWNQLTASGAGKFELVEIGVAEDDSFEVHYRGG